MASTDPLLGILVDERYRLDERVGAGAFGAVYRARNVRLGTDIALKILSTTLAGDPKVVKRFEREARTTAGIHHPNVVATLDFGEIPGVGWYMASEFVDGQSLKEILSGVERLSAEDAVAIAAEVCEALDAVHAVGVVHRDIKPANIMLERRDGRRAVRLVDFGIAAVLDESSCDLTASNACIGSPTYMAPEQALGEPVGPATDLYSLAVILFQMVTGHVPFYAANGPAMLAAHCSDDPPAASEVCAEAALPPEFDALVLRAMAKSPLERFADARAMRDALAALPGGLGSAVDTSVSATTRRVHASTVEGRVPAPERPRRLWERLLPLGVATAAGAALATVILVSTGAPADGRPPPLVVTTMECSAPEAAPAVPAPTVTTAEPTPVVTTAEPTPAVAAADPAPTGTAADLPHAAPAAAEGARTPPVAEAHPNSTGPSRASRPPRSHRKALKTRDPYADL